VTYPASGDAPERAGAGEAAPVTDPGAQTQPQTPTTGPQRGEIPRTRTARVHNALLAGTVVLILLLVFIIENTQSVKISYFGAGFHLPLGAALLLAAIGGALLVGIVGTARIVQLRRRVRHPR
jgi:lipopolysaccharide assembly protein A